MVDRKVGRWILKKNVQVGSVDSEGVDLTWLGQRLRFKAPSPKVVAQILECLQSPQSLGDLATFSGWSEATCQGLIDQLASFRLLALVDDANENVQDGLADPAYFRVFGSSVRSWNLRQDFLGKTRFGVVADLPLPNDFLSQLNLRAKVIDANDLSQQQSSVDVLFLLAHGRATATWDHWAATIKTRVFPVQLDPYGCIVGPFLGREGQPCLSCLHRRVQSREALNETKNRNQDGVELAWPKSYWQKLGAILHEEISKAYLEVLFTPIENGALIFDFLNHRSSFEELFPVPGCRICQPSAGMIERL